MSNERVRVVARMIGRPEKLTALSSVLLGLLGPTRQENGCVSYQLLRNDANACEFVFVEEWENDAALNAHLQTPHLQDALTKAKPLLAKLVDARRYTVFESE